MAIAIRTARRQGRRRPRAGRRRHRRRLGARARVRGVRAQGGRGAARGRDRRGDADRHVRRLSSKGVVVLLALVGAGLLLVSAFRPWVTGAVDDAVLGATRISATGAEVAPGLTAVALAIGAAAIAVVAAGRVARVVAARRVRRVPRRRGRPRRARAARPRRRCSARSPRARVGRTGSVETVAEPTVWPWVALLACAGRAARARRRGRRHAPLGRPVAALRGARPGRRAEVAGPRGERVASDWDELSAGRDPTDVGPGRPDLTESTGSRPGPRPPHES